MFEGTLAYTPTQAWAAWESVRGITPAFHVRPTAPCPWCGSRGLVHNRPGPNPRAPWAVVCAGCEARGPTATTPGDAVERWDAYAAPTAAQGGAH